MAKAVTPQRIIIATSEYFDLPVERILDVSNKLRHVTYARHLAMYITSKKTRLGCVAIAQCFGHKNHASVTYAVRQVGKLKRFRQTHQDIAGITANIPQD